MTIAVGEALLAVGPKAAVKEIEDAVVSNMQDWGKRYPHAGYGGSFRHWLKEKWKWFSHESVSCRLAL